MAVKIERQTSPIKSVTLHARTTEKYAVRIESSGKVWRRYNGKETYFISSHAKIREFAEALLEMVN